MYTSLGTATLKTGERMELGVVECPDAGWAAQIVPLLGHKGQPWEHHVQAAVREPLDALQTLFYIGTVDGAAVSNVMIVGVRPGTPPDGRPSAEPSVGSTADGVAASGAAGVGILGHVYTVPEHRRKGAYSQLMAVQMEHTRQLGYRVLTLGTGFESPPYWIYHSFGFRSIDGTSGRMKWLAAPDAEAEWFRPGATTVRPMRWDDWAPLNLVASRLAEPDEELPRSMVFRLKGHGSIEGSFLQLRRRLPGLQSPPSMEEVGSAVAAGRPAALTLASEHGAAVGWAVLQPDDLSLGESWLLDCYIHPAFRAATGQLLSAVPWPEGKRVAAYSSLPDGYRAAALRQAGFRAVAELPDWLTRPQPAGAIAATTAKTTAAPGRTSEPLRVFVRAAAAQVG